MTTTDYKKIERKIRRLITTKGRHSVYSVDIDEMIYQGINENSTNEEILSAYNQVWGSELTMEQINETYKYNKEYWNKR